MPLARFFCSFVVTTGFVREMREGELFGLLGSVLNGHGFGALARDRHASVRAFLPLFVAPTPPGVAVLAEGKT